MRIHIGESEPRLIRSSKALNQRLEQILTNLSVK